jgi:tRNA nucleotidyltransferase (CCA-adding enzyme)
LYHQLHEFRTELILYMLAATHNTAVKKNISLYYNKLRNIRPSINGNDLIAAGLDPGPAFRSILDAVLDAKLNGELASRRDELEFVDRWIQARG